MTRIEALQDLLKKVEAGEKPDVPAWVIGEFLSYDHETGLLRWKAREPWLFREERHAKAWNSRYAGREAFTTLVRGYRAGSIFNRHVYAHRAAWACFTGKWPETIDHINGDKTDNRIVNLRDVPHFENMRNLPLQSGNATGAVGVSYLADRGKWVAHVTIGGKTISLGHYDSERDAKIARSAAAKAVGFHANHGRPLIAREEV